MRYFIAFIFVTTILLPAPAQSESGFLQGLFGSFGKSAAGGTGAALADKMMGKDDKGNPYNAPKNQGGTAADAFAGGLGGRLGYNAISGAGKDNDKSSSPPPNPSNDGQSAPDPQKPAPSSGNSGSLI